MAFRFPGRRHIKIADWMCCIDPAAASSMGCDLRLAAYFRSRIQFAVQSGWYNLSNSTCLLGRNCNAAFDGSVYRSVRMSEDQRGGAAIR